MHMSVAQWVFSIAGFALLAILVAVMYARKSRSEFPIFFSFIAFTAITQVILLIAVRWPYAQYFYTFWSIQTLYLLLGFGVLYESVVQIMKPYSALADFAKMLFFWAGAFVLAASFLTALATGGTAATRICAAILFIQRCVLLMQCGLLLLFLLFEKRLGVPWRSQGMCIAIGLGLSAVLDLSMLYLPDRFPAWQGFFTTANNVLSNAVYVFWLVGMYSFGRVRSTVQSAPNRLILQRWNEALASYGPGGVLPVSMADSFIPGVEQAVERVLSRKAVH